MLITVKSSPFIAFVHDYFSLEIGSQFKGQNVFLTGSAPTAKPFKKYDKYVRLSPHQNY